MRCKEQAFKPDGFVLGRYSMRYSPAILAHCMTTDISNVERRSDSKPAACIPFFILTFQHKFIHDELTLRQTYLMTAFNQTLSV